MDKVRVPHQFKNGGNGGNYFTEYRREFRCRKCKALCADQETQQVHEMFCDAEGHRWLSNKLKLPDKMKKILEKKQEL